MRKVKTAIAALLITTLVLPLSSCGEKGDGKKAENTATKDNAVEVLDPGIDEDVLSTTGGRSYKFRYQTDDFSLENYKTSFTLVFKDDKVSIVNVHIIENVTYDEVYNELMKDSESIGMSEITLAGHKALKYDNNTGDGNWKYYAEPSDGMEGVISIEFTYFSDLADKDTDRIAGELIEGFVG